jgi:FkbM family methyltransferase
MSFLNKIIARKNIFPSIIRELKQSSLPLIIYGAGISAKIIQQQLKKHKIQIYAFITNKYLTPKNKVHGKLYDYNVLFNNRNCFATHTKYNLFFAGFAKPNFPIYNILLEFQSNRHINQIFFYDDTLFNHFNLSYAYLYTNKKRFEKSFKLLHDEKSKEVFCAFINAKISGDIFYLKDFAQNNQYFVNDIIHLEDDEVFLDAGAYTGDTIDKFLKESYSKAYKKIYAFEPCINSYNKLKSSQSKTPNIKIMNIGLWNKKGTLHFMDTSNYESRISFKGKNIINVDTIDNLLNGHKVTFIKMDIEGSEIEALQGAIKTIQVNKPKLAICVYHKKNDLITIPQFLNTLEPKYRFFLRIHCHLASELVLYATV